MNTYTVTITSKNQITLPARLVRSMGLSKGEKLEVTSTNNSVKLTKTPTLEDSMAAFHKQIAKKLKGKRPLTNAELSRAARDIWASGEAEWR